MADFFERCIRLIKEMEFYSAMRRTRGVALIFRYSTIVELLALLVAFVLNIFMISQSQWEFEQFNAAHLPPELYPFFQALGIILMSLQTLLFINFWFGELRIHLSSQFNAWAEKLNREAIFEAKQFLSVNPPVIKMNPQNDLTWLEELFFYSYFTLTFASFYKFGMFAALAYLGFFVSPAAFCIQPLQMDLVSCSAVLCRVALFSAAICACVVNIDVSVLVWKASVRRSVCSLVNFSVAPLSFELFVT